MNLAGVAEELLGKIIRANGGIDQLTEAVNLLSKIQETTGFWQKSKKDFKKLLGSTKNSIKHMENIQDSTAKLYFEVEDESKWLIQAAIRNLDILGIHHSGTVREFTLKYREIEGES